MHARIALFKAATPAQNPHLGAPDSRANSAAAGGCGKQASIRGIRASSLRSQTSRAAQERWQSPRRSRAPCRMWLTCCQQPALFCCTFRLRSRRLRDHQADPAACRTYFQNVFSQKLNLRSARVHKHHFWSTSHFWYEFCCSQKLNLRSAWSWSSFIRAFRTYLQNVISQKLNLRSARYRKHHFWSSSLFWYEFCSSQKLNLRSAWFYSHHVWSTLHIITPRIFPANSLTINLFFHEEFEEKKSYSKWGGGCPVRVSHCV